MVAARRAAAVADDWPASPPSYGAMTLGHFGTGSRGATSNTAISTTERPAPYPPPKEAAQSRYAAQRRRPTLAISPYASSKCRPDRESVRCRGSSVGASRLGPTAV
jgi:hypothetical protein